jgi:septal ring factor EnvC (AmiA/AmiB activator)
MNRNLLIGSFVVLAAIAWGCARGPDPLAQKNRDLEVKMSKMLADITDMQAKLSDLDQRLAREQARTKAIETERDALAKQVRLRTDERDGAQQQLDGVVKNLESLLGQAKAARAGLANADTTTKLGAAAAGW